VSQRFTEILRGFDRVARAATFAGLLTAIAAPAALAQAPVRVDSLEVVGNSRVEAQSILALFAIQPGQEITYRAVQRGTKELLNTGQFENVVVRARGGTAPQPYVLTIEVVEAPIVRRVGIEGLQNVSAREVRDTTGLNSGFPLNRQRILDAKEYIRQELAGEGIPFADVDERLDPVEGAANEVELILEVSEGQRVTVAEVVFHGNDMVDASDLQSAMSTKKEGFWWFRTGSYTQTGFREDLEANLPRLYRTRGFLDFQVVSDTLIVDTESGKARLEVTVDEGPQYRLGAFSIEGNTVFEDEELEEMFRSTGRGGLLGMLGLSGGGESANEEGEIFDAEAFNGAIQSVQERYRNEGYLYAQVNPVVDIREGEEGDAPAVDATWQIAEGQPAIVNRVNIAGNEYTYEWVIRNQLFIVPGDVYSQARLLQTYQNISALGFFESPLPFPDVVPLDNGDVDITFNVVEKQTGSVNFGTSIGGGIGLSGFVGYEQPNLFGQAKAGTLRWDFGRYINAFEMSYSDPALFQTRTSGTLSLFNSRDRFYQFATGRRRRLGSSVRFGFPWRGSQYTRLFVGYAISRTKYELFNDVDDNSLFGRPPGVQSQLSSSVTRQTLNHPIFPTVGSRQNLTVEQNGGFLGGDGDFTRLLADGTWWVPVGQLGGDASNGTGGVQFALGLTLRGGAIFGDAGAFPFDRFWMGGVQFGQNLRGYDETTITPRGYYPERSSDINDIDRLGDAFFSLTAEYAVRLGGQLGVHLFYDAGNVWRDPAQFDPQRLYRGAGIGMQIVTPFGPLGLDYAYGFDRTEPGWQLHFRMSGM
jgi:outer membrane protein insertion porin family